uniref:Uncharacterized protein n=1 Tax=Macaca fascicularis TaxID=9541 RepID=A0A7N9CJK5_MACFA
ICWMLNLGVIAAQDYSFILILCLVYTLCSRVHVHNMQVCYICIHVPCWCAAPINSSFTLASNSFSSV